MASINMKVDIKTFGLFNLFSDLLEEGIISIYFCFFYFLNKWGDFVEVTG